MTSTSADVDSTKTITTAGDISVDQAVLKLAKAKAQSVVTEGDKGQDVQPKKGGQNEPAKEIKFDDLDPEIQRFIDQERTSASRTSRERALRDAVNDPEIEKAIRERIIREDSMTLDEKLVTREKAIALRENRLEAREKLVEAGLVGDELTDVLELLVTDDLNDTMSRAEIFVTTFNEAVAKATEAKTRELVKGIPKPKVSQTSAKPFKDLSFKERAELKERDPSRYNAEMEKLSKKI